MRAIFLTGTARESSLRFLLEHSVEIIAVITPHLTKSNRRFEKVIITALDFSIPVIPLNKNNVSATLRSLDYDMLITCSFSYIIDKGAIKNSTYAINPHPTLL